MSRQALWPFLAGALSAGLLTLAFPPIELSPIAFVALVPLLTVVLDARRTESDVLRAGGTFAFLLFAWNLRWFWSIFGAPASVLWATLAFVYARTLWLAARARARWGDAAGVLATAVLWVGAEHFRSECWALKFGWITPGYSQAADPRVLQAVEWAGVYGLTFLMVLASAACAWALVARSARTGIRAASSVAPLALFLALSLAGQLRLDALEESVAAGPRVRVALLQYETNAVEDGLRMLDAVPSETQLVVFPELGGAMRGGRLAYVDGFEDELRAAARARGMLLVVGTEGDAPGTGPAAFYNTLSIVEPTGELQRYTKAEPVPLFADGVPSTDVHAYDTSLGRLGFAICYDFTHPHVTLALEGARAFVVASGDLASWTELQHAQHARVTHVRAVEHRRWVARATSSGYSQFIDPLGRVVTQLGYGEVGILTSEIGLSDELTPYAWLGLWPARACLLAWALAIARELALAAKERRSKK